MIQRALISVTKKDYVVSFALALDELGVEIITTGGTRSELSGAGIPTVDISSVTGIPEMLDGRVKTLDYHVAGGILAVRGNKEHEASIAKYGINLIDMVVVNLYDFASVASRPGASLDELVEKIDVGGPTMIRAAAKNWKHVAVVTSPEQYRDIIQEMIASKNATLSEKTRWKLAQEAFVCTARYDEEIKQCLLAH